MQQPVADEALTEEIGTMVDAPRVFLSYSHDSDEHADRVLQFADQLRQDGIDAILDQYEPFPEKGWTLWMEKNIRDADWVLMVCTETYRRRVEDDEAPAVGRGVRWEGRLIRQYLYDAGGANRRFVPVLLQGGVRDHIPSILRDYSYFSVSTPQGYETLYRLLTDQPRNKKPKLGKLKELPPRTPLREYNAHLLGPQVTSPMSSLSGPQRGLLHDAVLAAFPQKAGLPQWLDRKVNTVQITDDANVLHCVSMDKNPGEVAFDLVNWLEARGRIIEFLAKLAPDFPNEKVLQALREILGCLGNQSDARQRIQEFLEILAKQPRDEKVIRFVQQIPGCPDPLPESLILGVVPKSLVVKGESPTNANNFVPRTEDVAKAIRSKLDALKDSKVLDENDQEVRLLSLVAEELGAGVPSSNKDLSEHIAAFLVEQNDSEHCGLLVWRVFDLLCKRGKKEQAQIIGEVVDLMLPLCLPRDILSEAWRQLQDHGAVLIQNTVARKAGAEILVAGLFKKPTRFRGSSPEPIGEQLVGFESVPIGNPDRNEESALRELHVATFYANKNEGGKSNDARLTADQMRQDLRGHYRSRRLGNQRPSYCAVELASSEMDRQNQAKLLASLAIPARDLLFIGLKPDSKTREFESFVIDCLNTRFKSELRGFPA